MTKLKAFLVVTGIALAAGYFVSCGSKSTSSGASDGSTSITAAANMSGEANSTEGQVFNLAIPKKSLLASALNEFLPQRANASSCIGTISGVSCVGSSLTIPLGGCSVISSGATATGNLVFTWTAGSCINPPSTSASGAIYTRTAGDPANPIIISNGIYSVTVTTQTSTGYSITRTGGSTITCGGSGCANNRSITINGINWVGTLIGVGSFNHTISTSSPITITGTGSSRSITGGTVVVQHNLAQYTAISTVTSALGYTAGCCFPTSGSLSTTFSGGSFNGQSESLAFTSTCGTATLTNSAGKSTSVSMPFCI